MSQFQNLLTTRASFQDVLDALETRGGEITERRRQELARAVRRHCDHLGRRPPEVPAAVQAVRHQLEALAKTKPRLTKKTLGNMRSLLNAALREVSYDRPSLHRIRELPAPWARLWSALHEAGWSEYRRTRISPLIRFAAGLCAPEEMSDTVAVAFADQRRQQLWEADPEKSIRNSLREWNKAVEEIPGWPQQLLTISDNRQHVLRLEDFPDCLQEDIRTFEHWALNDSAGRAYLDGREASKAYKPRTVQEMIGKLMHAVRLLAESGNRRLEDLQSIEDVLNMQTIPLVLETISEKAEAERDRRAKEGIPDERKGAETAHELTCVVYYRMILAGLVTMGRRPPLTEAELQEFRKWTRSATPDGHGQMTVKNTTRVAQFRDEADYYALQDLPYKIFAATEKARKARDGKPTHEEAVDVASAVMLRLQDVCPLRPGNLAALNLRQLIEPPRRGGAAVITIGRAEMKGDRPISFEIDADTYFFLKTYLRIYLPVLGPDNGYLFPGSRGRDHVHVDTVTLRLQKLVRKHLGKTVNGHLMRHIKALHVLRVSGRNWDLAADTLGHRSTRTTRDHYAAVNVDEAVRTADNLIDENRRQSGHGSRPRFKKRN